MWVGYQFLAAEFETVKNKLLKLEERICAIKLTISGQQRQR